MMGTKNYGKHHVRWKGRVNTNFFLF
jgi:hypothetical protein